MRPLTLLLTLSASCALAQTGHTVRSNNQTTTFNCSGANDVVTVRGNNNRITLTGTCENLVIYGNNNVVGAATLGQVWLKGNNNSVTAAQQAQNSKVHDTGNNNRFNTATSQPVRPTAARL